MFGCLVATLNTLLLVVLSRFFLKEEAHRVTMKVSDLRFKIFDPILEVIARVQQIEKSTSFAALRSSSLADLHAPLEKDNAASFFDSYTDRGHRDPAIASSRRHG
jgi:hypothetical protein